MKCLYITIYFSLFKDTVVGLDAISRYAILVNKKEPNVKVSLATKTDNKDVEITKRDRTKTEVLPFSVYPNEVKAKIVGDGCVAIQVTIMILKYANKLQLLNF